VKYKILTHTVAYTTLCFIIIRRQYFVTLLRNNRKILHLYFENFTKEIGMCARTFFWRKENEEIAPEITKFHSNF
jgi:hypothetical protein